MKKLLIISILIICSCQSNQNSFNSVNPDKTIETITLLGDTLVSPDIKEGKSFEQFKSAQINYFENKNSPEALIWYGRRVAYLGYYKEAITIFTLGIKNFPNDARFYRHRGHRYISTRQYDNAISDFKKALVLIDGAQDQIEPDGLPNKQNIPLTTLHGNIWYHLGLAYYLKNDMNNASLAFNDRSVTHKYDDNIVSSAHWLYMIYKRQNKIEESNRV
jgi:tetratricopeptide (TPR) repeat protein